MVHLYVALYLVITTFSNREKQKWINPKRSSLNYRISSKSNPKKSWWRKCMVSKRREIGTRHSSWAFRISKWTTATSKISFECPKSSIPAWMVKRIWVVLCRETISCCKAAISFRPPQIKIWIRPEDTKTLLTILLSNRRVYCNQATTRMTIQMRRVRNKWCKKPTH